MYACENCKKTFCRKYNLDRHLNKKNKCNDFDTINNFTQKNEEIMCKNVQKCAKTSNEIIIEHETTEKENNTCQYCNKSFSRLFTLNRHIERYCVKKNKTHIKKDDNAVKLDEILYENKKILDKVRDLEDKISNTPPSSIITTNNTNTNIHVTNNILNFTDLNYDIDQDFMYNCLKSGFPGDIQYLRKVYVDTIPRECRPVRCLDPSRDKCMVRKNGEWIASTGHDIYRESLRRLIDNYLRVNNTMLEESEGNYRHTQTTETPDVEESSEIKNICETKIYLGEEEQNAADIEDYLNEYSVIENENSSTNAKIDEYVHNLNRITRMMEEKNVDRVRRHMNILLK